jgi:hypothetical protein
MPQLICLQALPTILEDVPNRETAQSEGLASVLLYNLSAFPSNSMLQLTALHALVVLLRPLGGNAGTPNSSSARRRRGSDDVMVPSPPPSPPPINSALPLGSSREPRWEENSVRVMLDALRRHSSDGYLQAMGCWAMVNAALYPTLKRCLLRLGGVYAITNAMMLHPNVEAVQFRGLFALINLVIPGECRFSCLWHTSVLGSHVPFLSFTGHGLTLALLHLGNHTPLPDFLSAELQSTSRRMATAPPSMLTSTK